MDKIRKEFIFYGRVQGVGFRYHSYHAANEFGLTGWVRNLYDGTVQAQVQGSESDIDRFLERLYSGRYIQIEDIDIKKLPVEENESSFNILD